jgi:predicted flap endonuclease-1-like 5' DNA nuclease
MTTVISAVRQIDSREDLGAVEDRLTAIEYSLAALHHMMRARTEAPAVRSSVSVRRTQREPQRPPRDLDPINAVRRVDDQANLLVEAAFGPPDDLKQINGVGPILSEMLQDLGIFYFWQVAEWTPDEIEWVDSLLEHFRGRIVRDRWTEHAKALAAMPGAARRPLGYEGRRENI